MRLITCPIVIHSKVATKELPVQNEIGQNFRHAGRNAGADDTRIEPQAKPQFNRRSGLDLGAYVKIADVGETEAPKQPAPADCARGSPAPCGWARYATAEPINSPSGRG